jgi:hypothetical protein
MPNHDVIADLDWQAAHTFFIRVRRMDDSIILNADIITYFDAREISSNYGPRPDTRMRADRDISDHRRHGVNKSRTGDFGLLAPKWKDHPSTAYCATFLLRTSMMSPMAMMLS